MSYEGYEQLICANGHLCSRDAYEYDWKCSECDCEEIAWSNSVDDTNCESFGEIIDMDQFIIKPAVWGWKFVWRKMTKGFVKVEKSPEIYRIPTKEETKRARTFIDTTRFDREPGVRRLCDPAE